MRKGEMNEWEKEGSGDEHVEVDESLYSRQMYTYGADAMVRMQKNSVFIMGMDGLGIEVAKNVVLSGVKSVTIADPEKVRVQDLGSQFFLDEDCVGKNRAECCVDKLQELNEYVKVKLYKHRVRVKELDFLKEFNIVVFIGLYRFAFLKKVNEFCHENNIKFLVGATRGLFGYIFADFGTHEIIDLEGTPLATMQIAHITRGNPGIVTNGEMRPHPFRDGDTVTFKEVSGMTELNGTVHTVKRISRNQFSIGDTSKFSKYKLEGSGGYAVEVRKSVTRTYLPLAEAIKNPKVMPGDSKKWGREEVILNCFRALPYFDKHGEIPNVRDPELLEKFIKRGRIREADYDYAKYFLYSSQATITPLAATIGGFLAQEIVKASTGKYSPLDQFLVYDAVEAYPDDYLDPVNPENYVPLNTKYDSQVICFGRDVFERIRNQRYFIVGAGAIGSEILKNFSMMGLGSGENGKIVVTDMDTIEKSNLNRQFLFRNKDIGSMKSTTAVAAIVKMNPDLEGKCEARNDRVGKETEDTYNDEFYDKLTGVCNALDNVEARLYMNGKCFEYGKSLMESGTMGVDGQSQIIVPHVTQGYRPPPKDDDESFPICTILNFPFQIEHCVQWAMSSFEGDFNKDPMDANQYLDGTLLLEDDNSSLIRCEKAYNVLVAERVETFDDCVRWARKRFERIFYVDIKELTHTYPKDATTESGAPFWSGHKRYPTAIKFDPNDELHMKYIVSAANLKAFTYGIKGSRDVDYIKKVLSEMDPDELPKFVPKTKTYIVDESIKDPDAVSRDTIPYEKLSKMLPPREEIKGISKVYPNEFEKDDDSNFHIDYVYAMSNLRAINYKIEQKSRFEIKGIAGKIIPAIPTTTAVVAGLVCIEFYKLVQGVKDRHRYRDTYVHLDQPKMIFVYPREIPKKKLPNGREFTAWDIDVIRGKDTTIGDVVKFIKEKYDVDVDMISMGKKIIYSVYDECDVSKKILDIFVENGGVVTDGRYSTILVPIKDFDDEDGDMDDGDEDYDEDEEMDDTSLPKIRVIFKD